MRHRGPYGDRIPGITPKSAASLAAGGSDLPAISDLAQPVHHYRSDTGITKDGSDFVSQWDDLGSGAINVAQATGSKQPLWSDDSANFGGRPILTFDGTDDFLVGDSNMTAVTTPWAMAIVMRYTGNSTGVDCVLEMDTSTNDFTIHSTSKKPRLGYSTVYWRSENDVTDAFIWWFFNNQNWYNQISYNWTKLWGINYLGEGVGGTHNNQDHFSPAAQKLGLGALNTGGTPAPIDVAELIMFNTELTGLEMDGLLSELRAKYDIS